MHDDYGFSFMDELMHNAKILPGIEEKGLRRHF